MDSDAQPPVIRDRIKELRRVPASDLRPNPKNWRTHSDEQRAALSGVLSDVGIADAVIARECEDGTLELIDGHLRQETLPDSVVPVLVLDVTEAEADKLLLTLDPLAALAGTDGAKLTALLDQVDSESAAVKKLLADLATQALAAQPPVVSDADAEPQIDRAEELRVKWGVESGQLWQLGEHRLLCGDCREADGVEWLLAGEQINVAFTSPPYAEQREYDESSGFRPIPPDEYVDWWEEVQANVAQSLAPDGSFFVNIKPHCTEGERSLYVFDLVLAMRRAYEWRFIDELCWRRKGVPGGWGNRFKNEFEPIYHFSRKPEIKFRKNAVAEKSDHAFIVTNRERSGRDSVFDCNYDNGKVFHEGWALPGNVIEVNGKTVKEHNAAFPVGLPKFFIAAYSDPGDVIYEPFSGSGSTLIAAEQLGRRCFGVEISPAYCAVILQRFQDATGKTPVLLESP